MKPPSFDVVVVGAGVAGSCTALFLRRRGHSVLLLDGGRVGRHKVCGEFLSPESQHTFVRLGIWSRLQGRGAQRVTQGRIYSARRAGRPFPLPHAGWALGRSELDLVLWEACQESGVTCCQETRVANVEQRQDEYAISTRDYCVTSRQVVLAVGRNSRLGKAREVRPKSEYPPRFLGLKTHLRGMQGGAGQVRLFGFSGGYCGLVEVAPGVTNASLLVNHKRAGHRSPSDIWEMAQAENPYLAKLSGQAQPLFPWLSTGNMLFDAGHPLAGGLLNVGDAAGYIHPLAGNGMAMAARAAELAGAVVHAALSGGLGTRDVGPLYEAAWQREFDTRLRWAGHLQYLLVHPALTTHAVRLLDLQQGLTQRLVALTRGPA